MLVEKQVKRVVLIVLDSFGIGEMPDASEFGDCGSHTLRACVQTGRLHVPNLTRLGLFNIEGAGCGIPAEKPLAAYARMKEASRGKDTTIGHWEIAGLISKTALPTYPKGFPPDLISEYADRTGRKILCNLPYSGTEVLKDFGREQMETEGLIVYTSADSVFQVAAHEEVVPPRELYRCCETARELLTGKHGVGRVIARPFLGRYPDYIRTSNRHDFSLEPPRETFLEALEKQGFDTIAVGKIYDIFAGKGISEMKRTADNNDGMQKLKDYLKAEWNGICFVNLVDFDMLYGHRNDADGYTEALNAFDQELGACLKLLKNEDVIMITADHGCDPSMPGTDHSREYTPFLAYGKMIQSTDLGTRETFADIAATILDLLGTEAATDGTSFASQIKQTSGMA